MSIIGAVTMADPNRPGHVGGIDSGNINPLYREEHFGMLETRFLDSSFFRKYLNMRPVRGTDTLTNPRMGFIPLQKLARGIRAEDTSPTYDSTSIKVDTIVLARACEWTLEDFQSSYETRGEIASGQGEELGKFFDYACIAQAVKAAQVTVVTPDGVRDGGWEGLTPTNIERSAPEGFRGGTVLVFAGATDHEDPTLAAFALKQVMTAARKKEVPKNGLLWLMGWDFYETLSENLNLIDTDYVKDNGDYSMYDLARVAGVDLHPNNRMPIEVNERGVNDHYLSNASNGYAYNNTTNDVLCKAVLIHAKALLAGETIPLTTKVFWDDKDKQWYIDAWTAFAVTPNRVEVAAAIFEAGVS